MLVHIPLGLGSLRQDFAPVLQPSDDLKNSLNGIDLLAVHMRGGGEMGHDWVFELKTRKGIVRIDNMHRDFDPFYDWIETALNVDMAEYLALAHEKASDLAPAAWREMIWQGDE
ncbi:hypothetical protein [Hyphobacterium sp.]|uniref:hypothetical protein n=1 Tax=Hyphobacterium sp. TaxID=2004662 RepID=UPI00374994BA